MGLGGPARRAGLARRRRDPRRRRRRARRARHAVPAVRRHGRRPARRRPRPARARPAGSPPRPPSSSTASPPAPGSSPGHRASRGSPVWRPPRTRASPTPCAPLLGVLAVAGALAVAPPAAPDRRRAAPPRRPRRRHRRHHGRGDDDRRDPRPQPRRGHRRPRPRRRRHDRGPPRPHRRRGDDDDAAPRTSTSTAGDRRRGLAAAVGPGGARSTSPASPASPPSSRIAPRRSPPSTIAELPMFADVTAVPAFGFQSIGDAATGFEHYINPGFIIDDHFLDPSHPESLVYRVDGDQRTLVSAMFIAKDLAVDDPELVDWGGPLMQWHVHEDLCWSLDDAGQPKVSGVTDDAGNCPDGSVNAGGRNPMVHVWIAPHECGPFAALEGHGAGQAATAGARADQCATHDHGATADGAAGDRRLRPDEADRPVRRRGRHTGAAGVRREPRGRDAGQAARSGPIRPSPRPPASTRSATRPPGSSTTSSGTGSTTTCPRPRRAREPRLPARSPTGRRRSCRRCTCCRPTSPSRTCPTSAGR